MSDKTQSTESSYKEKKIVRLTYMLKEETEDFRAATKDEEMFMWRVLNDYPEFQHLAGVQIKLLFRLKPQVQKGVTVLGKTKACTAAEALLHHWQFIVWIDETFWKHQPDRREPLMFPELCHCQFTESGKPTVRAHDIEDFYSVFRRFGDWIGQARRVSEQLSVFKESRHDEEGDPDLVMIAEEAQREHARQEARS